MTTTLPEQHVVLRNIRWTTYKELLSDNQDRSAAHLTYDNGLLAIVVPSIEHEERNRTLAQIVEILAEEGAVPFRSLGSTTFKREDLARGFEPDSCFYIQNIDAVRGKNNIDLTTDPAPDLVIEIDITSLSIPKLPIYAGLGVPELWQYRGERVRVLALVNGEYQEQPVSLAFPYLTTEKLNELLAESLTIDRHLWLRSVRRWAQTQPSS